MSSARSPTENINTLNHSHITSSNSPSNSTIGLKRIGSTGTTNINNGTVTNIINNNNQTLHRPPTQSSTSIRINTPTQQRSSITINNANNINNINANNNNSAYISIKRSSISNNSVSSSPIASDRKLTVQTSQPTSPYNNIKRSTHHTRNGSSEYDNVPSQLYIGQNTPSGDRRSMNMRHDTLLSPSGAIRALSLMESPANDNIRGIQHSNHNTANSTTQQYHDDEIDDIILKSSTYRELYRIVRMCAAQPSCDSMINIIEKYSKNLINASLVRLFLVQRDGLYHHTYTHPLPLDCGIIGYVRGKHEIINLTQPCNDTRYSPIIDTPINIDSNPIQSMICIPIEADRDAECSGSKDVVAVIQGIRYDNTHTFHTRDCKLLYRLGEFIGNMLRNSRSLDRANALFNQTMLSNKRNNALLDIAKLLASETKLDSIVSIIVSQVPELLDSDRCTLFFVDKEHDELIVTKGSSKGRAKTLVSWIFGQSNAPELPFTVGSNEIRFSIHRGIAGTVALTGHTINIPDAHEDKRFNPTMDRDTGYRTRSILCVPMIDSNNSIIGVVQAINKNPAYEHGFDIHDETLLKTFAAQAALAVRNAQLLAKTENALSQSDAMLEVTQALSRELKIEALIAIICTKVQALLNSERCTVFFVDHTAKALYTSEQMTFGMGPPLPIDREKTNFLVFPMDRGIAGAVASTGKTVNIVDAYADQRFNPTMDRETGFQTRTILCMAIANHRNEIVGVLQVMNRRTTGNDTEYRTFDVNDEKLLAAFCAQAAVAMENSRLFQETEKALNHALAEQRNLKFMLSVTKNLFSDMHLTSMIDQMTMQVHHLLKADDCALYLTDNNNKQYYLAKNESDPSLTIQRYTYNIGIVGHVAATGNIVRISSLAHKDSRFHPSVDQRRNKVTHSILCCPITAEQPDGNRSIVGVISVRDEKDRGGFEQEEENLLKVFCAQAAVAIMNSHKFTTIMDSSDATVKERSDHSAADYLKESRGMNLTSDDIGKFTYQMNEITLKGSIGTGSYGEVYKAQVHGIEQMVAIKKLHVRNLKAEHVDSFCSEASLMCQLQHPNIVGFIGAITEPSNLSILTEYCNRGSLADLLLEESVQMTFRMKVKFALDSAQGMLYLHTSNPAILHRDLKSDNLLVADDWSIKVGDFGLTRFISEKKQMTQVGMYNTFDIYTIINNLTRYVEQYYIVLIGTPMWMAPEIIMGKKYTEKADVYAFGIILWEILTRLEPYDDKEPMQIVVEVVNDGLRPAIPSHMFTSPLVPLMMDAWQTEPDDRPTFDRIVERLNQIYAAIPINDQSEHGANIILPRRPSIGNNHNITHNKMKSPVAPQPIKPPIPQHKSIDNPAASSSNNTQIKSSRNNGR